MAKKAPKSAKKQNAEPASAAKGSKAKATKAAPKKAEEAQGLLSDAFYDKIEQFGQIYQEVNNIIEEGGKSDAFDLAEKERNISEKLEEQCSKVLKSELEAAEQWIQDKQEELKRQNANLEQAQNDIKEILEKTNVFSSDEVQTNLNLIVDKIGDNNKQLDVYDDLLQKARSAYAWLSSQNHLLFKTFNKFVFWEKLYIFGPFLGLRPRWRRGEEWALFWRGENM